MYTFVGSKSDIIIHNKNLILFHTAMSNGSLISYSRSHNNNNSYIVLLTVFPLVVSGGDCTAPTGSGPPSSLSHRIIGVGVPLAEHVSTTSLHSVASTMA